MSKQVGFLLENFLSISLFLEKIEFKKIAVAVFNEILYSRSELDEARENIKKLIIVPTSEINKIVNELQPNEIVEFIASVFHEKDIVKKFYGCLSKTYIKMVEEDVAIMLAKGMKRKEKFMAMIKVLNILKTLGANKEFISEGFELEINPEKDKFEEEFKNIITVNVEKKEFNKYLLKIKNVEVIFEREELEKMGIRSFCSYFEDKGIENMALLLNKLVDNFETTEIIKMISKMEELEKGEFYRFLLLYSNAPMIKAIVEELNEFDKKNFSKEYKIFKADKEKVKIKEGFVKVFNKIINEALESDNKMVIIKKIKEIL